MKIQKMIYACVALAGMSLTGVPSASADVTAVYTTTRDGMNTQTIRYTDKQHVRVDMKNKSSNQVTTLMQLGDKTYMITGEVVQDLDQLAQMMAMMGKGPKARHADRTGIKYEDTGRSETIAGIKGEVYRFVDHGKQHEVVLGRDKDLDAAVLGLVKIAQAMAATMPKDSGTLMRQSSPIKSMAMLRLDNDVHLQSIKRERIQASVFELPGKPQQFGGMGAFFGR